MFWREIAWNGVRFSAPPVWEPAKIGSRYLMCAVREEPIFEIKWEKVRGNFSPGAALKHLRSRHKKAFRETPLSEEWQEILSDFTARGFSWRTETEGGRGAILHCSACSQVTVLQFFRTSSGCTDETCRRVLDSFRDHSSDGPILWSIFDIRAVMPAEFQLRRHRFEAGAFELVFATKDEQITLNRWGPASALLGKGDLCRFAEARLHISRTGLHSLSDTDHDAVGWEQTASPGRWARLQRRVTGEPFFQWLRLWHVAEKNRILSVKAQGKKPIHPRFLERICAGFENI